MGTTLPNGVYQFDGTEKPNFGSAEHQANMALLDEALGASGGAELIAPTAAMLSANGNVGKAVSVQSTSFTTVAESPVTAGEWGVGSAYHIHLDGSFLNSTGSGAALEWQLNLGGTTILGGGGTTVSSNALGPRLLQMDVHLTITGTATQSAGLHGHLLFLNAGTDKISAGGGTDFIGFGTSAVDLSATQNLTLRAKLGTTGGASLSLDIASSRCTHFKAPA